MTSANPSYKPSEGKREEFRKYLEKTGVMDSLTRVLVNLYEETEKPDNALEYIRDKLAVMEGLETNKQLQLKLTDAEERIKELEAQLQSGEVGNDDATAAAAASISDQPTEDVPAEDQQARMEDNDVPQEDLPPEEPVDAE